MGQVFETTELGASASEVWKVVGDFVGLIEALGLPIRTEGDGIGMRRTITVDADHIRRHGLDPGERLTDIMVEQLESLDDASMSTSYSMPVAGPLPIADYLATVRVEGLVDGRCKLTWSSTFTAVGVNDDMAETIIRGIYQEIFMGLHMRFGD